MEPQNDLKEKMKQKKQDDQSQPAPASKQELEFLKAQVTSLQGQLQQSNLAKEETKLQAEANALKQEEDSLREEADLRKTLKDMLPATSSDELGNAQELSQKDMMEVMADAVGKSAEAQAKLIMSEVGKMVQGTDDKILRTQKALVEVMAGLDVNQTRSQFEDFDTYREEIAGIMGRTNLSTKEAYLLAKASKESLAPSKDTHSERPNQAPVSHPREPSARGEEQEDRYEKPRNPRAAFKKAASEAIDKLLAERRA